jgi:hypothetical protein
MIPSSGPELSSSAESYKLVIVVHASLVKLSGLIGAFSF